jgi:flavin reductase (DIM6/NTAB) family NADH-FMN oxidoreductase RutF
MDRSSIYKSGDAKKVAALVALTIIFLVTACRDSAVIEPETAFQKISMKNFQNNPNLMIGDGWLLVSAGNVKNFNMLTASWGTIGEFLDESVVFIFVRPQNYTYKSMKESDYFTLSVFEEKQHSVLQFYQTMSEYNYGKTTKTGLLPMFTELGNRYYERAKLVVECQKIYADYLKDDSFLVKTVIEKKLITSGFSKLSIGKILNVWERNNDY